MNIENGLTTTMLAAYTGYCRKNLQLIFKKQYGISPGEYIRKRKLTRAAVILRMTTTGVAEIAHRLHYSSHQNFIRAFRTHFGITPGQYRSQKEISFSGMWFPLLLEEVCIRTASIVYREAVFIKGGRMSYKASLSAGGDSPVNDMYWQQLKKAQGICPCRLYQVSSFSFPRGKQDNDIHVQTITGCACKGRFSVDTHCIPAGYYVCFPFQLSWVNFRLLCRKIYTINFEFFGLKLRWGYHVSVFDNHEGAEKSCVSGECLVPVEFIV